MNNDIFKDDTSKDNIINIMNKIVSFKQNNNKSIDSCNKLKKIIVEEKKVFESISSEINEHVNIINELINKSNSRKHKLIKSIIAENSFTSNDNNNDSNTKSEDIINNQYIEEHKEYTKEFISRESILSDLFKEQNYSTIYNIILSILIIYIAKFLVSIYLSKGTSIDITFHTTFDIFNGYEKGFKDIIIMGIFSIISSIYIKMLGSIISINNFKLINIIYFISISLYFTIFNSLYIFNAEYKTSIIVKIAICCELIRNIIKLTSFYYYFFIKKTNVLNNKNNLILKQKFLDYNSSNKDSSLNNASIMSFIYFYFAPTLLYNTFYPKASAIQKQNRLKNIIINSINLLLCFSLSFLHFEFTLYPKLITITNFKSSNYDFNKSDYLFFKTQFFQNLFVFIFNGYINFMVLIFGLLHSYHNLFAEILEFSDRRFYLDFWNSTTPIVFIKKTGILIYEFIELVFVPLIKETFNFKDIVLYYIKIIAVILFIEYIVLASTMVFCPSISFIFLFGYFISKLMNKILAKENNYKFKNSNNNNNNNNNCNESAYSINSDYNRFLTIILVTFSLGLSLIVITFEIAISTNMKELNYQIYDDHNRWFSLLKRILVPKVFYLYKVF